MTVRAPIRLFAVAVLGGVVALGTAQAATEQPYSEAAFTAAQAQDQPIVIHVTAPWCPTCAKQHPIVEKLKAEPGFAKLHIFDVDFDSQKPLLHKLHVVMQSTFIAYHGKTEEARSTGATSEPAIRAVLEKAKG